MPTCAWEHPVTYFKSLNCKYIHYQWINSTPANISSIQTGDNIDWSIFRFNQISPSQKISNSPLYMATGRGYLEIAAILERKGAKCTKAEICIVQLLDRRKTHKKQMERQPNQQSSHSDSVWKKVHSWALLREWKGRRRIQCSFAMRISEKQRRVSSVGEWLCGRADDRGSVNSDLITISFLGWPQFSQLSSGRVVDSRDVNIDYGCQCLSAWSTWGFWDEVTQKILLNCFGGHFIMKKKGKKLLKSFTCPHVEVEE